MMKKLITAATFITILFSNLSSVAMDKQSVTIISIPNPIIVALPFLGAAAGAYASAYARSWYDKKFATQRYTDEAVELELKHQKDRYDEQNPQDVARVGACTQAGTQFKQCDNKMSKILPGVIVYGGLVVIGSYYVFNYSQSNVRFTIHW